MQADDTDAVLLRDQLCNVLRREAVRLAQVFTTSRGASTLLAPGLVAVRGRLVQGPLGQRFDRATGATELVSFGNVRWTDEMAGLFPLRPIDRGAARPAVGLQTVASSRVRGEFLG